MSTVRCVPGAFRSIITVDSISNPSEGASVPDVVDQSFQISWIAVRSLSSRLLHNLEHEIAPEEAHLHQWDACHMICDGTWLKFSTRRCKAEGSHLRDAGANTCVQIIGIALRVSGLTMIIEATHGGGQHG